MQASFTTPPEPFRAPFAQRFRLAAHPTAVGYLPWAAVVLALVSFYYVFLASAGRFTDLKVQADYFDRMAEGFRAGHLYLRQPPPRELIVASNPFDHQFRPFWLWDASLYRGHFYLYWSPVPALALLAYKVVTQTHDTITDQWVTTALMVSRLCAGAGLISTLASRARFRQPTWLVCLAIAVFGLANPLPFVVARPHIYEGTLCGAQGFLFWGMLAAFWGLELPRRRRLLFALASVAWALAAGCRPTAYVAVPCLVAISWGSRGAVAHRGRSRSTTCSLSGSPSASPRARTEFTTTCVSTR
ncbi:MAG TPA: hypothetical protein VHU80_21455 [Polyangiaceae bacterium]|nr:hypothetical protein [Polyangiaceae bacterium]